MKIIEGVNDGLPQFSNESASGALSLATDPGAIYRLLRVELSIPLAVTASETFTVNVDAGDSTCYDTILYSRDLNAGSVLDLVIPFGKGYEFEADDGIDLAWTNVAESPYGVRVVYEFL